MKASQKRITRFACQTCGDIFPRWQGQCTSCHAWNSLIEQQVTTKSSRSQRSQSEQQPTPISDIELSSTITMSTGNRDIDTVFGQGLVQGAVTLLGGEPGIGKSTMALQIAHHIAESGHRVLYVSGEESDAQVALRARRLGATSPNISVYSQIAMDRIIDQISCSPPALVIIDSIQVVYHPDMPATAGSVSQVRHCATELIQVTKQLNSHVLLIGHITKDGSIAGPKVLEHLVDIVLFFEGERNEHYRLLRCFKNRFASTQEIGLFKMEPNGLRELDDQTDLRLSHSLAETPGSMIVPIVQGSRVMLTEIQALAVASGYGIAKRTFVGIDPNRANALIASLEKNGSFKLASKDIFLNVIGGLKIKDPSTDLGIVLAIISSLYDSKTDTLTGVIGEVGLTGEIRPVPNCQKRLIELEKRGFKACILPLQNKHDQLNPGNLILHFVSRLPEAIRVILGQSI